MKFFSNTPDVVRLRNDLTLWALGKLPLTLDDVKDRIIALDNALQDQGQ